MSFGLAQADVVTNATCAAFGYSAASAPAQCVQGSGIAYGPAVEANSVVSATLSLPGAPSNYLTADMSEWVSEVPSFGSNVGPSSASASANIDLNLFTSGPVRQGLLELYLPTLSWIDAPEGYSGQMELSLGSVTGYCQSAGTVTCKVGNYYVVANNTLLLPFTLGESFAFHFSQSDSVYGDINSGDSEGTDQTTIAFRLLEANGETPVALYDPPSSAPEPASFGILGLGIASIAFAIYLRRGHSEARGL